MFRNIKKFFLKQEKIVQNGVDNTSLYIYWGIDLVNDQLPSQSEKQKRARLSIFFHQSKKLAKRLLTLILSFTLIFTFIKIYSSLIKPAHAAWYDDNYHYRQLISFVHNADITTDRRVTITIDTATLITAGKMQSDCDDTRFTDINGRLFRYQLTGTCNNASTTYDVVYPAIYNTENNSYIYYGNPTAISASENVSSVTSLTPSGAITVDTEEKGPQPQLYLKFDEGYGTSTNDESPNNNDGSISGASWQTEDLCLTEKCLRFDGTDDVVTVTNASSIDLDAQLAGAFTFQAWIKPNGAGEGSAGQIFFKGTNTWLRVDTLSGGKLDIEASLDLATTDATLNVSAAVDDNKWNLVALSYTDDADDEITIWVNGRSVGSSTNGVGAPATDTNNLLISGTTTANFQGFIDEVKVYKTERSAAEIRSDIIRLSAPHGAAASFGERDLSFLNNSLAGYWKMNETALNSCAGGVNDICDSSGNGYDGAFETSMTASNFVTGRFGNGVDFDGTDDFVSAGDINAIDGVSALTISAWVNSDTLVDYPAIVSKRTSQSNKTHLAFSGVSEGGSNDVEVVISNGSVAFGYTTGNIISTGVWNHWVLIFDGSLSGDSNRLKFFFNGVQQNLTFSGTIPATTADTAASVRLGNEDTTSIYHNGRIDDVRVYKHALTPSEVASLYNWAPGPVGFWKLDDNSGTSANDSSGNDNTLTLEPSASWSAGRFGPGWDGNGANFMSRPDDADFDFAAANDFAISLWFKSDSATNPGANEYLIDKETGTGYAIYITTGGLVTFGIDSDSIWTPADTAASSADVYDGTWHHVEAVKTGTTRIDIYVDGVLVGSDTSLLATGDLSNADSLTVGDQDAIDDGDEFFGNIDDVRIYNYARTPAQIVADMNAGHPAPGSPVGSPVGYWNLDEGDTTDVDDLSINNNDLTMSATSWTANGKFNKAFNGTGAVWLTRADDADFDFAASQDFSVSLWVKSDSATNPSTDEYLVSKEAASAGYAIWFTATNGEIVCGIDDDATTFPEDSAGDTASNTDWYDNAWHNVVCVRNTTTGRLELYIDGKLFDSDSTLSATGSLENTDSLTVGDRNATDDTNDFNGDIDEVKIYRLALSETSVKTEFNWASSAVWGSTGTNTSGAGDWSASRSYCPPGDTSSTCAPVGEYLMDEGSGTSATIDTAANDNTALMTTMEATDWVVGKSGYALNFNNGDSNDSLNAGSASSIDVFTNFTVSAWIKLQNVSGTSLHGIVGKRGSSTGWAMNIIGTLTGSCSEVDGTPVIRDDDASPFSLCATTVFSQYTWYHLAFTNDGTTTIIYVNGAEDNRGSQSFTDSSAQNLLIGLTSGAATNAVIDQVRVYNYVLTPAQIDWDYNRGAPIAHYKFDECQGTTAYNSAVNANGAAAGMDGTITPASLGNTATGSCLSGTSTHMWYNGRNGKRNASLDFDGSDDYVEVADNVNLDFDDNADLTISGWFNRDTFTADHVIVAKRNGITAADTGYIAYIDDATDQLIFEVSDAVDEYTLTSTSTFTATGWNHFVIVWDQDSAANSEIYINGRDDDATDTGTIGNIGTLANALTLRIGSESDGANYFDGLLDDIRLYRFGLTAQQIRDIYNAGAVNFAPVTGSP